MSLHRALLVAALAAGIAPLDSHAQTAVDSVFRRAEQLVRDGNGARGRELVDSVLTATPEGSPVVAEALYWRAALSASTEEAERDFRRIIIDYPIHPRAENAMLRLAQLELARGDRERALAHLQRFDREHSTSPQRAWASLLLGRLYLEQQELPRGCAAIGTARATAPAEAAELRNQIEYYVPRCAGVDTTARVAEGGKRDADSVKRTAEKTSTTRASRPSTSASRTTPSAPAGRYTVQLAAFNTRGEAQSLVDALRDRKIEARVVGSAKPYRVRVGRFATRAEANEMLRTLTAKKMNGYVTEAEKP